MIVRLAWRSIWRNRRRTLITVSSIGLGLAFAIFFIGLAEGMYDQSVDQIVRTQAGHITLEHPEYRQAPSVDLWVDEVKDLKTRLDTWPEVEQVKVIILGQGMIRSGSGNVGAALMGVEPSTEADVSPVARNMVKGEYLEDGDGPLVVVGSELAERLRLDLGKKLVITSNDAQGNLVEELCRVKGVFRTGSEELDAYFVQTTLNFARRLFRLPAETATQVGLILKNADDQGEILNRARRELAGRSIRVLPWQMVMPDLASYIKMDRFSNLIFQGLLIFMILFTIFNTILMSVLERGREFALLSALGTEPRQVRLQVLMESGYLGLIGCGLGLFLGGLSVYVVNMLGLDFKSLLGEGVTISGFAISTEIHAKLSPGILLGSAAVVFGATLLLSLIPMRRAGNMPMAEMLR